MKLNKYLSIFATACAMLASCTPEGPSKLNGLDIEQSFFSIDPKGGSATVKFTAKTNWSLFDPAEEIKKQKADSLTYANQAKEYEAQNITPIKEEMKPITDAITKTKNELAAYLDSDEYIEDNEECEAIVKEYEEALLKLDSLKIPFDERLAPYNKELSSIKSKVSAAQKQIKNLEHRLPNWLTVNKMSGDAGEESFIVTADEAKSSRDAELLLNVGKETMLIVVSQTTTVEIKSASCQEVIEGADGKTYMVKGIAVKIPDRENKYGNWYLEDETGRIYIYGTKFEGQTQQTPLIKLDIEEGDEVTVVGPKTTYNGTVELVDVDVENVTKSLLTIESIKPKKVEKVGGDVIVRATYKGDDFSFENNLEWATIKSISREKAGIAYVTVAVDPNMGGKRSGTIRFSSSRETRVGGKVEIQKSVMEVTIQQKGSIIDATCAEVMAAPDGSTQYRVSGIVTKIANSTFGNLYIKDATGEAYIYGVLVNGESKKFSTLGINEGDIIQVVGPKTTHNGTSEMVDVTIEWHKSVTPVTAAEAITLTDDDKNDPKNYIRLTGKVTKPSEEQMNDTPKRAWDIIDYGNFNLVDKSGDVYVYGVSTGWKGETKKFSTLGVKEGDIITIIAYKTSYTKSGKTLPQVVGMYVSHEEDQPEPEPEPEPGNEFSTTVTYTPGTNSYNDGVATVNEVENVVVFKTGTSKAGGDLNFTIPAGKRGLRFYAVAWKGNTGAVISVTQNGEEVATIEPAANDGATGNSPYTLTVAPGDQYELDFGENLAEDTTLKLSCDKRILYIAVQAF